jgi:hypothetical protein
VAAALALAGCGGDGSLGGGDAVPAEDWIEEFCAAGVEWHAELEASTGDFQAEAASGLSGLQEALARYLDRSAELTDEAVARIEGAGVPDVEEGERIAADFTELIADVGTLFEDAAADVREADTSDERQFVTQVTEIAGRIETTADEVAADFTELAESYDVPELERAFGESESCAEFGAG